jgi:hypothetical protein
MTERLSWQVERIELNVQCNGSVTDEDVTGSLRLLGKAGSIGLHRVRENDRILINIATANKGMNT